MSLTILKFKHGEVTFCLREGKPEVGDVAIMLSGLQPMAIYVPSMKEHSLGGQRIDSVHVIEGCPNEWIFITGKCRWWTNGNVINPLNINDVPDVFYSPSSDSEHRATK